MVYTTTLLLIAIVVTLNVSAMVLRWRLRRAYSAAKF
jgi:ABC-type phosphate transport system permease subunit